MGIPFVSVEDPKDVEKETYLVPHVSSLEGEGKVVVLQSRHLEEVSDVFVAISQMRGKPKRVSQDRQ